MADKDKDNLFGDFFTEINDSIKEPWENEWQNMPEFTQRDLNAEYALTVNFKNLEDMQAFAKLIDQKITYRTRSIWYPKNEIDVVKNLRYIDEQ